MAGLNFPGFARDQMKSLLIQSRRGGVGGGGLNYLNLKMLSMNKKCIFYSIHLLKGMIQSACVACILSSVWNLMKSCSEHE